jgi:hypothetical protein
VHRVEASSEAHDAASVTIDERDRPWGMLRRIDASSARDGSLV